MTSNHHAPYVQGCAHATMVGTTGRDPARVSQSLKAGLSSDWSLQLDSMKPESLVIPDQQRRGEYCSRALYTPPVTPRKLATPEVSGLTRKGGSCRRWG